MTETPTLYTPEEAATIMHTSAWWIRDNIRAGKFPHLRVGNRRVVITAEQLTQIITLCTKQPAQPVARRIGTRANRRTS